MGPTLVSWLLVPPLFLLPASASLQKAGAPKGAPTASPNLLVDVSPAFVNAAVQQTIDRVDPICDVVLDAHVQGQSHSRGQVQAVLVPNPDRASLHLVLTGTSTMQTVARSGPVFLYSNDLVEFQARRAVVIDSQGVRAGAARACAVDYTCLLDLSTRFTGPVVDCLVRRLAYRRYLEQKPEVEYETARRAEALVVDRFDADAAPQLRKLNDTVVKASRNAKDRGVALDELRFSTTKDALRVRAVVNAAARPGPLSPTPVLGQVPYLGVRMHESLVNHVADVTFAGKTLTEEQLDKQLGDLLGTRPAPSEDKRPWSITFAREKPVIVAFANHGFAVVIRGTEFTSGESVYQGMNVVAKYKFQKTPKGLRAVRQGLIEAFPPGFVPGSGKSLSGSQQALRSILQRRFAKILKEEFALELIELPNDLRKVGPLVTTRAEGEDGWLALTWRKGQAKR